MRRQVTVGGLVALALLTGSVVAFAQPPVPADCAPADTEVERVGLVPGAPVQDDPDEDAPADDPEPSDANRDEPADDEPVDEPADDPAADEPADEPAADEPAADEPADEPAADEPADEPAADEPADDEPTTDRPEPSDDRPAGEDPEDPAADEPGTDEPGAAAPAGDDPAGDEPARERPTDDDSATASDPGTGADDPASGTDPCVADAAEQTAAAAFEWGAPTREDDFDGAALDRDWEVYSGTGFDGQGTRTADALSTQDGVLTITGDAEGATGGMAWGAGQMYGRWEARVRTPEGDPSYNALLLLWPDDESGAGSEVDFMEMLDPTRQTANAFLHSSGETVEPMGEVAVDGTEWHNWAVEWTPTSITAYLDGVEWWTVDDPDLLPQGPMHLCVQLDWFPTGDGEVQESSMEVEWVREYAVDVPTPADDPAAGEEPAGEEPADDAPAAGDEPADDDPAAGDQPAAGDNPAAGDDPANGRDGPGDGDRDAGSGDNGGGDGGGGDSDGAPSASLREGAPDDPARPGLVPGAARG